MTETAHPADYTVSSIYESNPDPMMLEDGYEVEIARASNGAIHSLLITDYQSREVVEMPPEVAIAMARAILDNVGFPLSAVN